MRPDLRTRLALALVIVLASFAASAQSIDHLVTETEVAIAQLAPVGGLLEAAKTLFWSLAAMSLVWTIGLHVLRQDIGEVLMELVRFSVVTGIFYWLLVNASDDDGGAGFIGDIVGTFFELGDGIGGKSYRVHADTFVAQGLHTLFTAIRAAENAEMSDQLLTGGIAILILVMLTIVAAQFLMALVMAWLLGYAGIFLLGFGGARWSSPLAISYYKHAVAMGIMLLVLGLVGKGGLDVFIGLADVGMRRADSQYTLLGMQLAVSVLLLVAGVRIPQFFYTMVTGSPLGLFAGAAGMIGSAIATGGGAALAAAAGHIASGGSGGGGGAPSAGGGRTDSVMDAVHRSSVSAAAGDPFHVGAGTDPFGVPRAADGHRRGGSVFGGGIDLPGTTPVPAADKPAGTDGRREGPRPAVGAGDAVVNRKPATARPGGTQDGAPGEPPDDAAATDAAHRARSTSGNVTGGTSDDGGPPDAVRTDDMVHAAGMTRAATVRANERVGLAGERATPDTPMADTAALASVGGVTMMQGTPPEPGPVQDSSGSVHTVRAPAPPGPVTASAVGGALDTRVDNPPHVGTTAAGTAVPIDASQPPRPELVDTRIHDDRASLGGVVSDTTPVQPVRIDPAPDPDAHVTPSTAGHSSVPSDEHGVTHAPSAASPTHADAATLSASIPSSAVEIPNVHDRAPDLSPAQDLPGPVPTAPTGVSQPPRPVQFDPGVHDDRAGAGGVVSDTTPLEPVRIHPGPGPGHDTHVTPAAHGHSSVPSDEHRVVHEPSAALPAQPDAATLTTSTSTSTSTPAVETPVMQNHAASLDPIQDSSTSQHAVREPSAPDMTAAHVVRERPLSNPEVVVAPADVTAPEVVVAPAGVTASRARSGMASPVVVGTDEGTPRTRNIRGKTPSPDQAPSVDVAGTRPDEDDSGNQDTHDSP